jgi:small conductance mechanosensitive channel
MNALPLPPFVLALLPIAQGVLKAFAILALGWIVSKWVNRLARAGFKVKRVDPAVSGFLAALMQYTVLAAAVLSALGTVGIQTTSLVAVFASAGFAVGAALQGSLASFASGVMILLFRPFDLEHKITADGHTGVVKEIGLFATTLLTVDNETVLIPNSAVTKGSIVNHSAQGTLRGIVGVTVAWGNDLPRITEILLASAKKSALVLQDPAPAVIVTNVQKSLDLGLAVWTKPADQSAGLHEVRAAVHEDLLAAGIEVPPGAVFVQVNKAA